MGSFELSYVRMPSHGYPLARDSQFVNDGHRFALKHSSLSFFWDLSFFLVVLLLALPTNAQTFTPERSEDNRSQVCDEAASFAASKKDIPKEILLAVTRTETGRDMHGTTQPWPWTVNMEGRGIWFDSREEGLNFVFDHFLTGARSFDIGCFQINYRWHGANFSSIEDMFDSYLNAEYAASFLRALYLEKGNWKDAVGAFHSRSPRHSDRYIVRFDKILDQLVSSDTHASQASHFDISDHGKNSEAHNSFPLIQSGSITILGSLVPLDLPGSRQPIINLHR
jgi:hypothetical protein